MGEAHEDVVGSVLGDVVEDVVVCAADGVDGGLGPPCVGARGEEDFYAGGGGAVEGGVEKSECVGRGEFVAEGDSLRFEDLGGGALTVETEDSHCEAVSSGERRGCREGAVWLSREVQVGLGVACPAL